MLCAVLAGCAQEEPPVEPPAPAFDEQGVVNESWRILKMATAHDIITLEVEVADLESASEVARELMTPLESRYAEALIYVYGAGEGEGGHVPAMRFQWTADGGIVAMEY
jgi:alpha-mannosidase